MNVETIPISKFRMSLSEFCRSVRSGKKKIVVTHYYEPRFEVVPLEENQIGIEFGLLGVRDRLSDFWDLLEENDTIFLTAWNKRRVACIKL